MVNKLKRKLQKELSSLTFDPNWIFDPETVQLVEEKWRQIELLSGTTKIAPAISTEGFKVRVVFSQGKVKIFNSYSECVTTLKVSRGTIERYIDTGNEDRHGRKYEGVS